jgi:hypothetical protein
LFLKDIIFLELGAGGVLAKTNREHILQLGSIEY